MRVVNDVKPTPQEILEQVYSTEAQEAREAHESYLGNNPGEEDFGAPVVAAETISEPVQELRGHVSARRGRWSGPARSGARGDDRPHHPRLGDARQQ